MATNKEILTTIISALSSLKEGDSITTKELSDEVDLNRDTVHTWLDMMNIITDLGLTFIRTARSNQLIVTKSANSQKKYDEILKLLKAKN